jgi:outer membrane receptor protein involved in Fe transport
MRLLLFGLMFSLSFISLAQDNTGSIAGKLTDREMNDDPLPFANVLLKGTTTGTTSDFDGLYEISGLEPGSYTVVFSYLGYETIEVPNVSVEAGKVTEINVPMSASEGVSLDEVVVAVVARKDSEVALLLEQKQAVEIKESIGAIQLAKIGVSDVATATTKISGVTASEGSGDIYVRGLGDRYLSTTLNGLPVPSDDVEKKNIDLSLFPTRVIQNVGISKTYGVQNYADQASGTIDITSRELTGDSQFAIGAQGGINTNVAGVWDNFKVSVNSEDTRFGFYTRPSGSTQDLVTSQGWNTRQVDNPVDYRFSFVAGKRIAEKLAVLLTGSHAKSYEYGEGIFKQYRSNFVDDSINDATNWNATTLTTGLLDLTYFINEKHKLKSATTFINTVREEIYEGGRDGSGWIFEETDIDEGLNQFIRDQNTKQTRILVTQLFGTHRLSDKNTLEWGASYNLVNADEPNRIRNEVNVDPTTDFENDGFVQLGRTGGFQQRKSSQEIEDNEYNGYLRDLIKIIEEDNTGFDVEVGAILRNKQRDFRSLFVGVEEAFTNAINPPNIDNIESIMTDANFEQGLLRYNLLQADLYDGTLDSKSAYADINVRKNRWNFNGGLRFQQDEIDVNFDVGNFPGRTGNSNKTYSNLYPSLNVKYDLNEKSAIRAAVSQTITLPEFKEIAPFEYVSQVGQITRGNPDLEASRNLNYDLKWEFYPSNAELISVAAFYKEINDPINRVQDRGAAGIFSYFNSGEKAEVFGLELESRLGLIKPTYNEDLGVDEGIGLDLIFNVSRMWHNQDLKEVFNEEGDFVRTFRYAGKTKTDLQGASDWILNTTLNFSTPGENPWNASLIANYADDKIFALGAPEIQTQPDVFYNDEIIEKGFVVLDAVVIKSIGEHWRIRAIGRNLLNPEIKRTQLVRPSTTNIETEETVRSYTTGVQIRLGLAYTF